MSISELARETLETLQGITAALREKDPDERYRRMQASFQREAQLKAACKAIITPPKADLFTEPK